MKAMVLAAGLGTRLKPITFEIPKPMVPVLDRPVMAHTLGLLERNGFDELIANVHYYPDSIRDYFGDRLEYRYEEELLGTAGGVRNVADFFGDEPVVIVSGDALTDLSLRALVERHESTGGIATLTVRQVPDTREYGVVVNDEEGRIQGFQEKPDPAEALSDLGNCGIYCFSPEIFDYFPSRKDSAGTPNASQQHPDFVDWAADVFPVLLEHDVPFYVHETTDYWNDVGSLDELRQGTYDALEGDLRLEMSGERVAEGVIAPAGTDLAGVEVINGPVWIGTGVTLGDGIRLMGPVVIGDGASVGDQASLRDTIVFPGTQVRERSILIGAVLGSAGITASLRPLAEL